MCCAPELAERLKGRIHILGMAIAIDRLKKKHDIVTYREIDRFLKGELDGEFDSQGFARRYPALGVMVKLLGGAVIGLMLAGLLLVLEGC